MTTLYLVIKEVKAEDFEHQERVAVSNNLETCKKLAKKLNKAVEEVELYDNICYIEYYVTSGVPLILTPEDIEAVYENHKEDRG